MRIFNIFFLVLALSPAVQAGPLCSQIFANREGEVLRQLISLKVEIIEAQAAGRTDLARLLNEQFRSGFVEARSIGINTAAFEKALERELGRKKSTTTAEKRRERAVRRRESIELSPWKSAYKPEVYEDLAGVAVLRSSRFVYYVTPAHELTSLNLRTGETRGLFPLVIEKYERIRVTTNPTGSLFAIEHFGGRSLRSVEVRKRSSGKVAKIFENAVQGEFSADGKHLLITTFDSAKISSYSTRSWDLESEFSADASLPSDGFRLAQDGRAILISRYEGVEIWDAAADSKVQIALPNSHGRAFDLTSVGGTLRLATPLHEQKQLAIYDVASSKVIEAIDVPGGLHVTSIRFSPDGRQVLATTENRQLLTWEIGQPLRVSSTHNVVAQLEGTRDNNWMIAIQHSKSGNHLELEILRRNRGE